jgi:hypothetical protein
MKDYDAERRFLEKAHYFMGKCEYRMNVSGVGWCPLRVLPCEKVFRDGNCEAVYEWMKEGEE